MGPLGQAAERLERLRGHAQLVEGHRPAAAVQQPQHDRLPVQRRHGRHPEIELTLFQPHADPPVLRRPPLRDVQLGEQLHP